LALVPIINGAGKYELFDVGIPLVIQDTHVQNQKPYKKLAAGSYMILH
jgi:hypothetical protein